MQFLVRGRKLPNLRFLNMRTKKMGSIANPIFYGMLPSVWVYVVAVEISKSISSEMEHARKCNTWCLRWAGSGDHHQHKIVNWSRSPQSGFFMNPQLLIIQHALVIQIASADWRIIKVKLWTAHKRGEKVCWSYSSGCMPVFSSLMLISSSSDDIIMFCQ